MNLSQFTARLQGRYQRSAATFFSRRPFEISSTRPLISFTFDDFPRSALYTGGAILARYGLKGTYYASLGLMGKGGPTGDIFLPQDLDLLLEQEHELGCHTFSHCDSWDTSSKIFERSVVENSRMLNSLVPGASFRTFSYPISPPHPRTKRTIAHYFDCCRGGGQTFNGGVMDLNYLASFFMEQSRNTPEILKILIEKNREARGWLIFSTHDVCATPTPFGCTPEFFEDIVAYAVNSGARILPVIHAWEVLRSSSSM